jgi:hypothetical protein
MAKIAHKMASTGQFCTVTFITKNGEIRKINGRSNVVKYLKGTGERSDATAEKYLLIWTRKGSPRFDAARNVNKSSIISIKAHGVTMQMNNDSLYRQTV